MVNVGTLAAIKASGIPLHLQKIAQEELNKVIDRSAPEGAVGKYAHAFRNDRILKASESTLCGKGLWLVGKGSTLVASALVQSIVGEGFAKSATWVHIDDILEEGTFDTTIDKFSDLMVIQGIGEHHKSASGFADTMVSGLLTRRFNKGLPTLVPTSVPLSHTGLDVAEMFMQVMFR